MYLVADIGGTKMRVAGVVDGALSDERKVPTPQDPTDGVAAIAALARECAGKEKIEGLAGCIAGTLDRPGVLSDARNLRSWEGANVVELLSNALGAPVYMVNDAALAGLGEGYAGAAKGTPTFVYVTVSTGVGGAFIQNGEIVDAGGVAGIQIDGEDLEDLISGTSIKKRFGIDPKDFTSLEERTKLADILARGLQAILARWPASLVILGGSMMVGVNPIPLERVQETLNALLADAQQRPLLKLAALGDDGGLWGGVARLKQLH
jgi:predicted NBD/HSP70 family sugar kinase